MKQKTSFVPHQLTKNVKLLHKVAVIHQGRVLILKRAAQSFSRPSCWDLPGGNSEWPNDLTQNQANLHQADIVKELKEETGLSFQPSHFSFAQLVFLRTFFETDRQVYTIILGWRTKLQDSAEITLSLEHTDFAWVKQAQLDDYDFGGQAGEFVKEVIQRASQT
ncbi:MAG: hypothetical protein GF390_01695 [Candidatus Pacebacteria bacterium]|nr:hypothetical protein [Candidatus Paceibacterota bacterium]